MPNDKENSENNLFAQIEQYLNKKQGKKPSRVVLAEKRLKEFGFSLKLLAAQNQNAADSLRELFDTKQKTFQFMQKSTRDTLYNKLDQSIINFLKTMPIETIRVGLEKILNDAKQFDKQMKPIDQLKSLNEALKRNKLSIFDERYFGVNAEDYKLKLIRIIMSAGTYKDVNFVQEDVNFVQERVKEINKNNKLIKSQDIVPPILMQGSNPLIGIIKEVPKKPLPIPIIKNEPKIEHSKLVGMEIKPLRVKKGIIVAPPILKAQKITHNEQRSGGKKSSPNKNLSPKP